MRTSYSTLLTALALAMCPAPGFAQAAFITEIRIDQPGTDVDEYIELLSAANLSLSEFSYIVIGDGSGGCGTIEAVLDLSPYSTQADGVLALVDGDGTPTLTGYDVVLPPGSLNFENDDNVTHLLVSRFTGADGMDLDTDDDGVLDVTPWEAIWDGVGLYAGTVFDCAAGDEYLYTDLITWPDVSVGPDGSSVPGHVIRCLSNLEWMIGAFDPAAGTDTPGSVAAGCPATGVEGALDFSTWGKVKARYQ